MLLVTIISLISRAIQIYLAMIWIYCLLTWLPGASQSRLGQLLSRLVEPYLSMFDRIIPSVGGIGFTPIIASFVLILAQRGLYFLIGF